MDIKRRQFMVGAAAVAASVGLDHRALASPDSSPPVAAATSGDAERNKRFLREARAAAQMRALPSALPGEEGNYNREAAGMSVIGFRPKRMIHYNDSLFSPNMSAETRALIQGGFASQALGPTFISYGPMLAEGDTVVEEWESQIYGANGTLYNNQYLSIVRFENDNPVEFHEFNDTHHASIIFGPPGNWPKLKPPTNPRRVNRHSDVPSSLPASEIETVFEVTDKFELDPRMLADVVPSASSPPVRVKPGRAGNKELVRGLRQARAAGDQAAVNSFYARGFRHFMAGERPLGWDHLPLQEIYAPLARHLASPLTVRYGPMVADDTRVFEQMDCLGRLDDGTVYNNWHAFVHEIRDGKIVQTREYLDTLHLWVVLGRWADWGKTPVPPRSRPRRSNLQGIASTIQYPTTLGPDLERWQPFPAVTG